ncbi:MAG: efflux RND transporter periplasmic adaptor subunit [Thermoguttaceae bacterium]|jgi:Cu(I)/Ag(I) efflux system membrane fusion protein|nr:efflux RND transporter periplasmic adaptor subunit [Thermoguttaceae bacterium]
MTNNQAAPELQDAMSPPSRFSRLLARGKQWMRTIPPVLSMVGILLAIGVWAGYRLAGRGPRPDEQAAEAEHPTMWTCSMMCVQLPEPGRCPVCSMDLVPLDADMIGLRPRQLRLTEAAVALADIQTTPIRRQYVAKPVRMVGKVDYDETRLASITARVPGRLDRLYVDYTGVAVRKGEHLVSIYSPELIVAQQELLVAHRNAQRNAGRGDGNPGSGRGATPVELAEEKLRLLGLLDRQIEEIKQRGTPSDHLTVCAPIGGVIIERHATEGMYVETGSRIYTIADLSQVWVLMDAYETDVPWLRYGQEVEFTSESHPGEVFHGRIAFIDPMLNNRTRTVRVRVNVPNLDGKLKPGMFVRALARSRLAEGGRVFDPSMAGKWISPLHPEIIKDEAGQCDICGIDLVPAEELGIVASDRADQPPLVIPVTAALITGRRAVVYVRLPEPERADEQEEGPADPVFEGREVMLGPRAGDYYLVRHGLEEGELVVTQGNFKLDSELQLRAQASMMSLPGDAPMNIPDSFLRTLAPLFEHYLKLQEALAEDEPEEAAGHWQAARVALEAAPESMVDRRLDAAWSSARTRLHAALAAGAGVENIQPMRVWFEPLAKAMLDLAATFGNPLTDVLYEAYCPMVDGDRGAPWLQAGETIDNPYFGFLMRRCGEIRRPFPPGPP